MESFKSPFGGGGRRQRQAKTTRWTFRRSFRALDRVGWLLFAGMDAKVNANFRSVCFSLFLGKKERYIKALPSFLSTVGFFTVNCGNSKLFRLLLCGDLLLLFFAGGASFCRNADTHFCGEIERWSSVLLHPSFCRICLAQKRVELPSSTKLQFNKYSISIYILLQYTIHSRRIGNKCGEVWVDGLIGGGEELRLCGKGALNTSSA